MPDDNTSSIERGGLWILSHNLRTPLTSIIGFAEAMLTDPEMQPQQRREFAEIIKSEGERLSKIVDEMFYRSVLDQEFSSPVFAEFNLIRVIDSAIQSVSPVALQKSLFLTADIREHELYLFNNRDYISQIVRNILRSSIMFSPEGGTIRVAVLATPTQAEIHVLDSGNTTIIRRAVAMYRKLLSERNLVEMCGLGRTKHLLGLIGGSLHLQTREWDERLITARFPRRLDRQDK